MLRTDRGGWPYGTPPNADFVLNTLSPQARGLVAWYPLGPGQYGITRDVLNRNNLTPYAGPARVGGSRGAVASFTKASSQYVAHLGGAFLDYPFTMIAWFRYLTAPAAYGRDVILAVSDRDDGYDRDQLDIYNASGPIQIEAFTTTNYDAVGGARIDTVGLTLGIWYHATGIFASATSRAVYLNASTTASNTTNLSPTTRDTIAIGAAVRSSGATGYIGAEIADARIYNRVLTLQEIKQLYRNPWELYEPVVRWWVGAALGGGGTDALTANGLVAGAPALGTPAVGQIHALTATVITTGAPALATPALGQEHALTADNLAAGAPSLDTPDIGQAHALTADSLATGAPILATPDIGQLHALAADALATDAPALGAPALGQTHALLAASIATDAPTLGEPTLGQEHALAATGITTGVPTLGTPTLGAAGTALTAESLAAGIPVLGMPTLGQVHVLLAHALLVGAPLLGTPALGITTLANERRTWDVAADTRSYVVAADERSSAVGADTRTRTV